MLKNFKAQDTIKLIAKLKTSIKIMAKHEIDSRVIRSVREKLLGLVTMTSDIEYRMMVSAIKKLTRPPKTLPREWIAVKFRPEIFSHDVPS